MKKIILLLSISVVLILSTNVYASDQQTKTFDTDIIVPFSDGDPGW